MVPLATGPRRRTRRIVLLFGWSLLGLVVLVVGPLIPLIAVRLVTSLADWLGLF